MGFKFKVGDMIVKKDGKATDNNIYIIKDTGIHRSTSITDGLDIYKVSIPNSINGHNRILDKGCGYIHRCYRLATKTEMVLYGQ